MVETPQLAAFPPSVQCPYGRKYVKPVQIAIRKEQTGSTMGRPVVYLIYAFVPFLWAALYCCLDLPHPKCSYSNTGTEWLFTYKAKTLTCYKDDLDIPINFNVNLIPEDVQEINLDCPLSMPYGYDDNDYCNTLRQSCTPVPLRSGLSRVKLIGFQTDQGRLPVAKFLENVKIRLDSLYIHSSRIGSLDSDFIRGFQNLTFLSLKGNDIETLDVNTFQSLVLPSSQATDSALKRKLSYIVLEQNKLQQLDWSVFRPLADCLGTVNIDSQRPGLRTLLLSGPSFNLSVFKSVDFDKNKLTTMPKEILQTFAIHPSFKISVEDNNMCSKEDCSCCEMQEFMRWAQIYLIRAQSMIVGDAGVYFEFSCGKERYKSNPREYSLDRYQNCPPS